MSEQPRNLIFDAPLLGGIQVIRNYHLPSKTMIVSDDVYKMLIEATDSKKDEKKGK